MTSAKKLLQGVFNGVQAGVPSEVLLELNRLFPLVPIVDALHLQSANRVAERLIDVLSDDELTDKSYRTDIEKYLSVLADLIGTFERTRYQKLGRGVKAIEVLQFLMEAHGLRQGDLDQEIGSQSTVSDVLRGARELNAKQIQKLANRFKISPAVFFNNK